MITGKGNHSVNGRPRIKPAVVAFLQKKKYWYQYLLIFSFFLFFILIFDLLFDFIFCFNDLHRTTQGLNKSITIRECCESFYAALDVEFFYC